jgi:hypothetical protein
VRYFRRLPPLLQVAGILGLLFPLAGLALAGFAVVVRFSSGQWPLDYSSHGALIVVNLVMLAGACSFAVNSYSVRFRRPQAGTFPLESWQSQVWAIALLAALPLCALAMMLLLSPGDPAFLLAIGISLLGVFANMLALVWAARVWGLGP